ncbi:MAG: type VI secretion system baseplate subunit TssK [Candidatus Korobacteraceae bacterium]|jgi:type VI secretion system protein ImpJ
MRFLSSIVWSEGMYLGPHHFQAQNRYFEDASRFVTQSLRYEAYGFTGFELDAEALRNGMVGVIHARGLFCDGLPFDMPECDPAPEARSIGNLFPPTRDFLVVHLAIPRRKPGGQNCAVEATADGGSRYAGVPTDICDENTGQDEKPVRLGRKNIRLAFDTESLEDFESLPIARIKRDTSGRFVFDSAFIPPCVRLTASETLLMTLRRLVEILEEKSSTLLRGNPARGTFQAGMSSRDVASFWFLHAINAGLGPLRHLFLSKRGHPEELFQEMSRLAGALCTFGMDSHPRTLPVYDHNQLDKCFQELDAHIRRHLEIMIPTQSISILLKRVSPNFYEGDVTDARAMGASRWLLAIHAKLGEADLIRKTPAVVKVCSAAFVPELVKRALPGMTLGHLSVPPSAISARVEFQYFAISKGGPCWDHIVQTRKVGVYVPADVPDPELELLVITDA